MPVIFRATEQWFIGVDKTVEKFGGSLREMALKKCGDVTWIPGWGEKRIRGMLESRPDWCISRQRSWGLPIPAFYNSNGDSFLTKESILAVANHIGQKGSNSWFTDSPQEILGGDFKLPAGFSFDDLKKEENIFDVWFESGCSWHSVAKNAGWHVPVDLYLEGSDQHRGWFQLSMLPALGAIGDVPFKAVLTHGFTVDEKGMKQSKSLGNYVNAQEEINKYGSDILRLWVSSVNYQEDMRCSDVLIGRLQDAYRKIRNTIRYLLGNINGFDAATMSVNYNDMYEIDKWAMQKYNKLVEEILNAYETFAFHRVFSLVYNFCSVDMSSIYMDVLKDRMYCDGTSSASRKSAQTTMTTILDGLSRLIAPVLAHTAEEIWKTMNKQGSIHLANMPEVDKSIDAEKDAAKWQTLMGVRDEVLKVLEELRKQEKIASNQEASVNIEANAETVKILNTFGLDNFAALCIVSEVKLSSGDTLKIVAQKSGYEKCARCWNFWSTVGKDSQNPDLCSRCIEVIAK
jgi:isoleucyl-tRNA synthetase